MNSYLIVLINYNNWQDTLECIDSLLNAGVEYSDIFVIENGSTNDSYNKLKSQLSELNIERTDSNLGFSGGNNLGMKYGIKKGVEYIILLNNDTIVEKNSIKILINEMNKNTEVSIGTGLIRCYPEKDKIWYAGGKLIAWRGLAKHNKFLENRGTEYSQKPSLTTFISGCYMCIRTSHLKDLGLLNEKFFLYLEDIEYSARAINKKMKLIYVPASVIYHKWRGGTKLKYQTLYYAVRNRKLLIDLVFPTIAKFYFQIVIFLKMIYWFITDRELFYAAKRGLKDYKKRYFGPI
jgi:GT2 family glycosyltransferase